jgi:hypothetical protein
MSTESDTRKLLEYRGILESRLAELEQEAIDVRKAVSVIDKMIVSEGFRIPPVPQKSAATFETHEDTPYIEDVQAEGDTSSITSKNGTVLGKIKIVGKNLVFRPLSEHGFTSDIPPFKSFLVDRVLANMSATDGGRVANGELSVEDALSYEVKEEDGRILELSVTNFGGERRLREITSSLRWSFDKMYDKLRQG